MIDVATLTTIVVEDLLPQLADELDDWALRGRVAAMPADVPGRKAALVAMADDQQISWPLSDGIGALREALIGGEQWRDASLRDALTCMAGLGLGQHVGVVLALDSEDPVAALAAGQLVEERRASGTNSRSRPGVLELVEVLV